jgi:hypothetical protein
MKTYRRVEVELHMFLTSALDGGEWWASRPGRFTPGERAPVAHLIKAWVDPRGDLLAGVKKKCLQPPGIEPWSSSP